MLIKLSFLSFFFLFSVACVINEPAQETLRSSTLDSSGDTSSRSSSSSSSRSSSSRNDRDLDSSDCREAVKDIKDDYKDSIKELEKEYQAELRKYSAAAVKTTSLNELIRILENYISELEDWKDELEDDVRDHLIRRERCSSLSSGTKSVEAKITKYEKLLEIREEELKTLESAPLTDEG